jgi:polyisoprenoid-binding protein YceI
MIRPTRLYTMALLVASFALTALAADNNIDAAKSTLIATFKQEGVAVDAPFKTFSGRIVYDPANVAAASAALDVDTGSLDIGDEAYSAEVRKKVWFDSAAFPKATFRSTAIKAGAAGHFDATGTLTVKGKALTVTVPVSMQNGAGGTAFDGSFAISRKAFGIGDPTWNDVLDDNVKVRFHLVSSNH